LTTEKQLVLVADVEIEHTRILQEEWTFLGYEYFEWGEIERLKIDFGICEIGVPCKVQDEVRTEAVLDIESAGQREFGVLPRLFVVPGQTVRLNNEEPSASDFGYARQFSCL
jgi:hypothetical protein